MSKLFPLFQRPQSAQLLLLTGLALTAGCNSDGDGSAFGVLSSDTGQAVLPSTPIQVVGRRMVFMADEASSGDASAPGQGTDFNGNGLIGDQVPVVVNLVTKVSNVLEVAAREVHLIRDQAFVLVDEAEDQRDWNNNGSQADTVLLNWSESAPNLTFVESVDPRGAGPLALSNGERLYFTADLIPAVGETSLHYVDVDLPTLSNSVPSSTSPQAAPGGSHAYLWGIDEGLLFAYFRETFEGADLNGDGDVRDQYIVALHDTTSEFAALQSTGLATAGVDTPFRARFVDGMSDWVVAFLANERSHSLPNGGFNDPTVVDPTGALDFQPSQCATEDSDLHDDVLHWIAFTPWSINAAANPPRNTGLSGIPLCADGARVVVTAEPVHVGTIQSEELQGGCDLNGDGDALDRVVRWLRAVPGARHTNGVDHMLAIQSVPGGTNGLAEMERSLVAVVDETQDGRDHNGDGEAANRLMAFLNPNLPSSNWNFDHNSSVGQLFFEPDGLTQVAGRGRLLSTVRESVLGSSLNFSDGDTDDSAPAIINNTPAGPDLSITRVASLPGRAGMVSFRGVLFYRASEVEDNRDWNRDGDREDDVLLRTIEPAGFTTFVCPAPALDGPAIVVDPGESSVGAAAYVASESEEDRDFNGDGDSEDFVVRYFRL